MFFFFCWLYVAAVFCPLLSWMLLVLTKTKFPRKSVRESIETREKTFQPTIQDGVREGSRKRVIRSDFGKLFVVP